MFWCCLRTFQWLKNCFLTWRKQTQITHCIIYCLCVIHTLKQYLQFHFYYFLQTLTMFKHENLVLLLGYSISDSGPRCLVYQYMSNGSLEERLACRYNTDPLTNNMRLEITKGNQNNIEFPIKSDVGCWLKEAVSLQSGHAHKVFISLSRCWSVWLLNTHRGVCALTTILSAHEEYV